MDTTYMNALEIADLIRKNKLTSLVATQASLKRISDLNPHLNAFVLVMSERALEHARLLDDEARQGCFRSVLHGVPVGVKDLFDIEGFRTGAGSLCRPDHRADKSAHTVKLLEEAGCVVVGKTQTVEFAFGGWGTNDVLGAPYNPFDQMQHRVAGGSSSGSAVAVASGMVPLALGTDTGGSIRVPSAFCGVFGHKSTVGLIGRGGIFPLSPSHDSVGVMGRDFNDVRVVVDILSGADPNDLATIKKHSTPARQINTPLKIAVLNDVAFDRVDPEIVVSFENFLSDLKKTLTCEISTLSLPQSLEEMCINAGLLMSAESYNSLKHLTEDMTNDINPSIRARINKGRDISASDLQDILNLKVQWTKDFTEKFSPYDLLLLPGAPVLPPPLEEIDESNMILSIFGRYANMLNLCGSSLPIGMSKDGLPMGVQVIARPFEDAFVMNFCSKLADMGLVKFSPPIL